MKADTAAEQLQLALDIGTRKVLGLCYRVAPQGIHIVASVRREHPDRAMLHGQIQDVSAVAAVVRDVVLQLEQLTGQPLSSARVAAAGRALRTSIGQASFTADDYEWIDEARIRQLQWEAVADAQSNMLETLAAEEHAPGYYCVGHSLVRNWVDDAVISSLAGQRGKTFQTEVLATFLPRTVVDSLDAALTGAGLELGGLSLEPIAALEAIVPKSMRHLNVCLVDIGAGTSDIALTRDGTVFSYAMVPQAGDSITEAVSRQWLLDFPVAEKLKRQARPNRAPTFTDILGQRHELDYDDFLGGIASAVDSLAEVIAATIVEWNGEAPDAVMLVGGGSLTPGLPERVAERLGMDAGRVAMRDRKAVRGVSGRGLTGPDAVTPLGIALLSQEGTNLPMVRVKVEDRWVRLFQPGAITVAEALRAAGASLKQLLSAHGPGITVTLNDHVVAVPGMRGKPGKVTVNGVDVSLDHVVNNHDEVWAQRARPGPVPSPTVAEVIALAGAAAHTRPGHILWQGEKRTVPLIIRVNGGLASLEYRVADRDVIEVRHCSNLAEMKQADPDGPWEATVYFRCVVNGEEVRLPAPGGDGTRLLIAGQAGDEQTPIPLGASVEPSLQAATGWPTLYEVLPFVEADAMQGHRVGQHLRMLVNGAPAQFTTPLQMGDRVEIRWEP